MTKLVLHIGLPKTATTAIQETLSKNKILLSENSILYPSVSSCHTVPFVTLFKKSRADHPILKLKSEQEISELERQYFVAISSEFDNSDADQIVISGEGISKFDELELSELKKWLKLWVDDIEVVVYLRDPINHCVSATQQLLKTGTSLNKLMSNPPVTDWEKTFKRIFSVFGQENVTVRLFENAVRNTGGIVGDFCQLLDIPEHIKVSIAQSTVRVNDSLSLEGALFIDRVNTFEGYTPNIAFARKITGRRFDLPINVKKRIFEATRSSVTFVEQSLGVKMYSYCAEELDSSVTTSDFEENSVTNMVEALVNHGLDNRRFLFKT